MEIKKLLFVTRFEALWFDALQSLLDLRKAALEHVVFLNVIQREKVAMRRGAGYQKKEEIKLREKANIRFIDWAETLFEQGMEVGVYIVVGSLARQTVEAARKEQVDLVVIGHQRKSKLGQFFTGSDISEIVERIPVPVLVYKYLSGDGKTPEKPFIRPLIAIDWSAATDKILTYIENLGAAIEQVDLVHVADEKSLTGSSAMGIQKTRKVNRQKLDEICDRLEAKGIEARSHVYIGDAVSELDKAARECQASMIITGAPEKGALKGLWPHSTPKALVEKSVFPVLLVPAD